MFRRISTVILDWSGTTIDAGVKAPAVPFVKVFKQHDVPITMLEARQPMGLPKDQHIRKILQIPSVAQRWEQIKGRKPDLDKDGKALFKDFLPLQLETLADKLYIKPLPKVLDTLKYLRMMGIKIGLTSGFNTEMTQTILNNSKDIDLASYFDAIIPADHPSIKRGRPYPDAVWANMIALGCEDARECLKVDDTQMGIQEGRTAGVQTLGLAKYNNYIGTYTEDIDQLARENDREYWKLMEASRKHLSEAQPTFVRDTLDEVLPIILQANQPWYDRKDNTSAGR